MTAMAQWGKFEPVAACCTLSPDGAAERAEAIDEDAAIDKDDATATEELEAMEAVTESKYVVSRI